MKKNISCNFLRTALVSFLLVCMVFVCMPINGFATGIDEAYFYFDCDATTPASDNHYYQYSQTGTVVCSQLTVRSEPSASSSEIGKMKNGQTCTIVGRQDDWLIVDVSSCRFQDVYWGYGYVKDNLIKLDPYWIATTQYTELFATPWENSLKNGEQYDRVFLVIGEQYPFYAVQCKEYSAGTSFIRMQDVGRYSQDGQNLHVCAEDDVLLYEGPYGDPIRTVDKFTIVNVDMVDGDYCHVVSMDSQDYFDGWMQNHFIQRIAN